MKQIFFILLVMLMQSCYKKEQEIIPKYQEGEVVTVANEKFIVTYYNPFYAEYRIKLINCKSSDCYYYVKESEITK